MENINCNNSSLIGDDQQWNSRKAVIDYSWNSIPTKSCDQVQVMPCGLKGSKEVVSGLNKETSRAGTNELLRKQLEENDHELKKFDMHMSESVGMKKQGISISNNTRFIQTETKPEARDIQSNGSGAGKVESLQKNQKSGKWSRLQTTRLVSVDAPWIELG